MRRYRRWDDDHNQTLGPICNRHQTGPTSQPLQLKRLSKGRQKDSILSLEDPGAEAGKQAWALLLGTRGTKGLGKGERDQGDEEQEGPNRGSTDCSSTTNLSSSPAGSSSAPTQAPFYIACSGTDADEL